MPEAVRLHGATLVTILWALLFSLPSYLLFFFRLVWISLGPEILMTGEILPRDTGSDTPKPQSISSKRMSPGAGLSSLPSL
ncbi:hypothetical protein V8C40DRAFT_242339 [Trichoderma camerunense]